MPPYPALPVEGERKRANTAQGDDRRVSKSRVASDLGGSAEHGVQTGRLMIEEDPATGDFVYRIVDENTGEVIRQWPREEVLRMRQAMNAERGALLDRLV